jgi:hypothetical protein
LVKFKEKTSRRIAVGLARIRRLRLVTSVLWLGCIPGVTLLLLAFEALGIESSTADLGVPVLWGGSVYGRGNMGWLDTLPTVRSTVPYPAAGTPFRFLVSNPL